MKNLDYKRILSIIAFLGCAGFSCFWTAESLFIWQPSLTIYGAWFIAIIAYAMASYCFMRLLKGFDKYATFGQGIFKSRGGHIFWGALGLIAFWLVISLPTNTHTLLYRSSIKEIVTTDLNRTMGYLQGLKDNNLAIKEIEGKYKAKKDAVDGCIARMRAETENPQAHGIGHRFERILVELDQILFEGDQNDAKLQRAANPGTTASQWMVTVNFYQRQAMDQLKIYRAKCDKEIAEVKRMMGSKELDGLIQGCKAALHDITSRMDGIDNNLIEAATKDLSNGYAFINQNSQYIAFKEGDKERYTRLGAIPEAKEMLSVPDVWKDFLFTHKYDGHGFIWWVFIALLVDLAGFIFCNMAFSKEQDS